MRGKRNTWVDHGPRGAGAWRKTAALPPPAPRRKRIEEAGEDEETARWGRAVPAGRLRRGRDVPEASAMADLCVVGWGKNQATRGGTERDGSGGSEPRKQQERKIWCGGSKPQRAAQIRGGLEHFRVGLSGPQ